MGGVMAHRLFSPLLRLPPLIHHEDGFNSDEANVLKASRNNFRRMALGSAHAVVVPSAKLADIALRQWGQSTNKVRLTRNGIDVGRYGVRPKQGIISGLNRSPGKLLVGTMAGLRPVKQLRPIVRAVASHSDQRTLVTVGEGTERGASRAGEAAGGR